MLSAVELFLKTPLCVKSLLADQRYIACSILGIEYYPADSGLLDLLGIAITSRQEYPDQLVDQQFGCLYCRTCSWNYQNGSNDTKETVYPSGLEIERFTQSSCRSWKHCAIEQRRNS